MIDVNIFKSTPIYYFQVPIEVVESGTWARLKPVSKALYIFLLHLAQQHTKKVMAWEIDKIMAGAGLASETSLNTARRELRSKGLVATNRSKGMMTFAILDPITKQPLEEIGDFDELSREQLHDYFMHHIGDRNPIETVNGLACNCPLHNSTKLRSKDLSISLENGGPWNCHYKHCGKKGKLVAFEMAIAERSGKPITRTQAHHNVQRIIVTAGARRTAEQAEELEERRRLL